MKVNTAFSRTLYWYFTEWDKISEISETWGRWSWVHPRMWLRPKCCPYFLTMDYAQKILLAVIDLSAPNIWHQIAEASQTEETYNYRIRTVHEPYIDKFFFDHAMPQKGPRYRHILLRLESDGWIGVAGSGVRATSKLLSLLEQKYNE